MTTHLRPIETRVLAMRQQGLSDEEIGRRIRKSPERVALIADLAVHPARSGARRRDDDGGLSPRQRRLLALRAEGLSYDEIAERFRRSPRYVRQLAGLAHFKKYRELLG